MNTRKLMIDGPTRRWMAVLLVLWLLAGCGPKLSSWKEEVQLQNGDVLTVQRTIAFKAYQPIGGGGGGSNTPESSLLVLTPARADNPKQWAHPPLLPMIFDPSGLKVNSLFPRMLKLAYSVVANKFVALAPMAKIPATAKTPKE